MAWPVDYAGWIARLKEWLVVVDLPDTSFGHCLDSAHQRLNRELSSQWMEASHPFTVVDGSPIDIATEMPDFNRMRLVTVRGGLPLAAKAINEFRAEVATVTDDEPSSYCVNNMQILIWPLPAADAIVDIDYIVDVPALSAGVASNIFSTRHPDVLLYAALVEATPFIAEDERLTTWSAFYSNIRDTINVTAERAKKGSTPLKREIKVM